MTPRSSPYGASMGASEVQPQETQIVPASVPTGGADSSCSWCYRLRTDRAPGTYYCFLCKHEMFSIPELQAHSDYKKHTSQKWYADDAFARRAAGFLRGTSRNVIAPVMAD